MNLRSHRPEVDEGGFTLVELLVVLVILPLILGAIAEALIVSLENSGSTSNRLSDSVNAQTTSAYFVRDVQGASWITTNQSQYSATEVYNSSTPTVCGPTSGAPGTLLVALYRPATQAGGGSDPQAFDVAYWLVTSGTGWSQKSQVVRYACSSSGVTTVNITTAPIASSTGNNPAGVVTPSINITPSRFLASANSGWTLTAAYAVIAQDVSPPATVTTPYSEIYVTSLTNFVSGPTTTITIATPFGPQTLKSCVLDTVGVGFTGCTGSTIPLFAGDSVTQYAMTGVNISVSSPASNWTFTLTGAPRGSSQAQAISQILSTPALLTLGSSGVGIQDHNGALQVNGSVFADAGSLSCSGNAKNGPLTGITGTISASGSTGGCVSPPAVGGITPYQDPIAAQLPPCFPDLAAGAGKDANGYYQPGKYSSLPNGATLETGVFEITTSIGGSLSLAPNAPAGSGVLLLLPGSEAGYPSWANCAASASGATVGPGIVLPPLGAGPLPSVFNNYPEMRNMWLWQDRTNTNAITWTGNGVTQSTCPTGTTHVGTQAGLAYAPGATVNLGGNAHLYSGTLAARAVYAYGDNTVVLTGYDSC